MKIKFLTPDRKDIVSFQHVEMVDLVDLSSDHVEGSAWLIQFSIPHPHGVNRIFLNSDHSLVSCELPLPFEDDVDEDSDDDYETPLPDDLLAPRYVHFVAYPSETDIYHVDDLLSRYDIPYARSYIRDMGNHLGERVHYVMDWCGLIPPARQLVYSSLLLDNIQKVSSCENLRDQLAYMLHRGEIINHLEQEEN